MADQDTAETLPPPSPRGMRAHAGPAGRRAGGRRGAGGLEDRLQHAGHSGALRADRRRRGLPDRHRGVSPTAPPCRWPAGARRPSRSRWPSGSGTTARSPDWRRRSELVDLDMSFDDIEPVLAGNICHRGVIFGDEVPGVDPWAMVATVTKAGDRRGRGAAGGGPGGDGDVRAVLPGRPRRRAPSRATGSSPGRWWPRSPSRRATSSASRSGRSGHLSVALRRAEAIAAGSRRPVDRRQRRGSSS